MENKTSYYEPSMGMDDLTRSSMKKTASRSAVEFNHSRTTMPANMDEMFRIMFEKDQKNKKTLSRKNSKRRNRNVETTSVDTGISTQELEKIIESQLASALVSVMTQHSSMS